MKREFGVDMNEEITRQGISNETYMDGIFFFFLLNMDGIFPTT